MSKTNSTAVLGKSGGADQTEQPSTHPKGPSRGDRVDLQMVRNVLLVWLDSNIDENSSDCQDTITQLRRTVNTIKIFTDAEHCINFLGDIEEKKACMIISDALGQQIVPLVHNMSQVNSIFVFCGNRRYDEEWAKYWSKIKGVFTEITAICEVLKETVQQCERDSISISIMDTRDDLGKKSLDQIDPSFMYTQIMKEILLTIDFEPQHFKAFIQYCREVAAENEAQSRHVDRFERDYGEQTSIWWYISDSFLYSMLNRALRVMDADLMIKLGFFVGDLHRQIVQLHKEQFGDHSSNPSFTLYRGRRMEKETFKKMKMTKGGLLSFNSFLSTSKDRQVSLIFAGSDATDNDTVGVLFVMMIDPTRSSAPFASIAHVGYFGGQEEEVLFSMHAVFRIGKITTMNEGDRIIQVELTLTSDKDNDLRELTDRIREETFSNSPGWARLGLVLSKMGQPAKAQTVYQILLEQATDERAKAPIYNQLGVFKAELGAYLEAIVYCEKSLSIQQQSLPPNHPDLASAYGNIGSMYHIMGDYPKALSSYEKELGIRQQVLSANHPDLATFHNNIAIVYSKMGDCPKALTSFKKALTMRQKSLPANHPDLATFYNNIGNVHFEMRDHSKALSSYEEAVAIRQKSLPADHPVLATSYNNIGNVHSEMGDYQKALLSYEKALAIWQRSLPSNHPDLASAYHNIGSVYHSMDNNPKALSYYEKALAIQQQSLPADHPDLASSYNSIGNVYCEMRDYPKALSSYEKALAMRQQSLPADHPDLASSYNNIGNVHCEMRDYPKALSSYEKALLIQRQSFPSNHPDLAKSYGNIGGVYHSMSDNPKALSFCEKALAIQRQSLPANHPDLASSYSNIGNVYFRMGDLSKARSSYQRAVNIAQGSLPPNHPHLQKYRNALDYIKKKM